MTTISGSILLTVAYDGRRFAGFVPQPGQRTVAGELLGALRALDPGVREIRGASRTDAGVHARGQRVAFDPTRPIPPRGWALGVARHLPDEIAVRRAAVVPAGFVPRFESTGKRYTYTLLRDPVRDPFLEGRAWRAEGLSQSGALERAREEAAHLIGTHDFAAFRSSADTRESTERTLRSVEVIEDAADPRIVVVDVQGDAFMHNMVRIIVGALVDVARRRLPAGAVLRALASKDRRDLGVTAPPDGLCLERVDLRYEGSSAWPPDGGEGSAESAESADGELQEASGAGAAVAY
jgi:tRNA pseudouridine38-40 synthase